MARIRTIKPEFPQSESTGKLSRDGRLLFVQLWTIVDDAGRTRAASRMLASLLYPYDDDAAGLIDGWLTELEQHNMVRRYEVAGSTYLEIVNWLTHQKIDKPSPSRLPANPTPFSKSREPSRTLATDLVPSTKTLDHDQDSEAKASGAIAPVDPSIAEREFFARGKEVLGKGAGGLLTKLKIAKGGNLALARAAIETASTKENPLEYIAGVIRGPPVRPLTPHQQDRHEMKDILNGLSNFASNGSGSDQENPRLLRDDSGQRPGRLRGGPGADADDFSSSGHRQSG